MNTKVLWIVFAAFLAGTCTARIDMDRLETSLERLKDYQYDKTQGVDLVWVETQVGMASADKALRARVEAQVLGSLARAKTHDARQFLCRQLRTVGTAQSVPQLEPMLTDPDLSHMARYALGRINSRLAGKALHRALGKTAGKTRAGIINTLVQAGYLPAASDIMKLVNHYDPVVSMAAIRAAGHFGRPETVKALQKMRPSASKEARVEIDAALLACARRFADKGANRSAAAIYQAYYRGTYADHLRIAGLKGLTQTSARRATPLLVEAIKGDNANLRKHAIAMMSLIEGKGTTDTLVSLSRVVPADAQEMIVRSLAARNDASVEPAIFGMTDSEHENVRLAALEALGDMGSSQAIPRLARAAASASGREAQTARASLARLRGQGIDEAFILQINSDAPKSRIEIIRAIGQRPDHEPFDALYQVAKTDPDSSVRREAVASMGRIARPSDLDRLVTLMVAPHHPGDRGAVDQAIAAVFTRMADADAQAEPILNALTGAPDEAKVYLLKLLTRPATTRALRTVQSAVASQDSRVSDAAVRALGEWPNPAPINTLYEIASGSTNQIHSVLSLRGYIRLSALAEDPTACYVNALKLTKRPDEIRLVLGGLHYGGTLQALELAESYMDEPALKAEACMAVAKVANVYCWQDRARATTALDRVIAQAPNDSIRNQAKDVLKRMEQFQSLIAVWNGAGPFVVNGVHDGRRVFDTVFDPEKDFHAPGITWRVIVPAIDGGGRIDLEKTFGRIDYCCAYLRTTVVSPRAQQARLKWGVDDYIKGWLNGEATGEGMINLRQGENTFIVKVGDHGGGWNFQCEILQPDGSPVQGLRFAR